METLILLLAVWLLSPIALGIALVRERRRRASEQDPIPSQPLASPPVHRSPSGPVETHGFAARDVLSLLMVQLELGQQRDQGSLDPAEHEALSHSLNDLWTEYLEHNGLTPDTGRWKSRREEAWTIFVRTQSEPPGPPPWRREPSTAQVRSS